MRALLVACLLCIAGPLWAVECRNLAHDGADYTVCEVDATHADLRLFLRAPDGVPLGSFENVDAMLDEAGLHLVFAMNAGMYHSDRSPVGLYVEAGQEMSGAVSRAGPGNFGLLPNGILCIREGRADVIETGRFLADAPDCRHATQSGPMLVIDGALHPRFLRHSDSLKIRNGVGTSADGRRVVFAISSQRVNFHSFARLFRDVLKLPQALYLDGSISRLYAPQAGRRDGGFAMGPIVGVVAPR